MNAYIKSNFREKVYKILGPEFGPDKGKLSVIVWSLYGLKSSGALFQNNLDNCMKQMGYKPYLADLDLWMRPKTRNIYGLKYYDYILH